jgi:3-methyladenine DNA glycosylase AlkD
LTKPFASLAGLKRELAHAADSKRAGNPIWFKTGKGQYAEADRFLGVSTPALRVFARNYRLLPLRNIESLMRSRWHEYRYVGLLILVSQYAAGTQREKLTIYDFYLKHIQQVNNWDLVDASAPDIVGEHLVGRSRRVLYRLADSPRLWERRIAMVATAAFISRGDLRDTFGIASRLLSDTHDLIHKAVGWMLREAGVQSRSKMIAFLRRNYARMPRTALRYAIEHLTAPERKRALQGDFGY